MGDNTGNILPRFRILSTNNSPNILRVIFSPDVFVIAFQRLIMGYAQHS